MLDVVSSLVVAVMESELASAKTFFQHPLNFALCQHRNPRQNRANASIIFYQLCKVHNSFTSKAKHSHKATMRRWEKAGWFCKADAPSMAERVKLGLFDWPSSGKLLISGRSKSFSERFASLRPKVNIML